MRSLLVALIVGALLATGAMALASGPPPVDRGYPPPGVTTIGFAAAGVKATDRDPEATIRRAVADAEQRARPKAFADARRKAGELAAIAGMELGAVWSVSVDPNVPYYGGGLTRGTFGINRFCGTIGRRGHRRHACNAPDVVNVYLTVTFAQA
jgi:hypothetical protein